MTTDVWPTVHAERQALADDLEHVAPDRWATPSLCAGWGVHDVLAHLVETARPRHCGSSCALRPPASTSTRPTPPESPPSARPTPPRRRARSAPFGCARRRRLLPGTPPSSRRWCTARTSGARSPSPATTRGPTCAGHPVPSEKQRRDGRRQGLRRRRHPGRHRRELHPRRRPGRRRSGDLAPAGRVRTPLRAGRPLRPGRPGHRRARLARRDDAHATSPPERPTSGRDRRDAGTRRRPSGRSAGRTAHGRSSRPSRPRLVAGAPPHAGGRRPSHARPKADGPPPPRGAAARRTPFPRG